MPRQAEMAGMSATPFSGFLAVPEPDRAAEELYAEDRAELGFVMDLSRTWAHDAEALEGIFSVARRVAHGADLSIRHRLLIVLATSSARSSSYCIYAWGSKFAAELDPRSAAAVVAGEREPRGLDPAEVALVRWARAVALRPHTTTAADAELLREHGWADAQIFAITVFAALRMAFATVNDALGVPPDLQLADATPPALREAIDFGRPLG